MYLWLIHVDVWQKPSQYCNSPPIKMDKYILKILLCLHSILDQGKKWSSKTP